jgi:predicted DNA binding CopG/RHH family protein
MSFALLVRDIGEKERNYMKKKIKYTNEPLGDIKIIKDFLPSPEELAFNEDQVKVTIGLSKSSIDFFKKEAKKNHTQYQKMIRRLLDIYVSGQKERKTGWFELFLGIAGHCESAKGGWGNLHYFSSRKGAKPQSCRVGCAHQFLCNISFLPVKK